MRLVLLTASLLTLGTAMAGAALPTEAYLSWSAATPAADIHGEAPAALDASHTPAARTALKGADIDVAWRGTASGPHVVWTKSTLNPLNGCLQCLDGSPLANCQVTAQYYDSSGLVTSNTTTTAADGCWSMTLNCATSNQMNEHLVISSPCCKTTWTVYTTSCAGNLGTLICDDCDDCVKPPPNMTGWWQLDELTGPLALDLAGGNPCAWTGSPTPTSGQYVQNSTYLTSISDYMNNPTPTANVDFGTGNFSIDAWIKGTNPFSAVRTIVDHRKVTPGTSQLRGYTLFVYLGNLGLQMADGTGSPAFTNFIASGPSLWDGQWHHDAATVFRSTTSGGTLYVDGAPIYTFNPTVRPNSLDNTGAFRIGQAYDLSSLAFAGNIDEVEIFKSTLSAQEILDIYTAGVHGKCKETCSLLWDVSLWNNQASVSTNLTICNYSSTPQTYSWSMTGQPLSLPNCTVNGPTVFNPAGGTVTVGVGSCLQIPVTITNPGGMVTGDVACYQANVTNLSTNHPLVCHGSISASGPGTCANGPRPWALVGVGATVPASFVLINMSDVPTQYPIKIEVMPMDMTPEKVVSLNGLPPGEPWIATFVVAPHDSVTITTDCRWMSADAFMAHSVIFNVDVNGDGRWEALASENLFQALAMPVGVDPGGGGSPPLGLSSAPTPSRERVEVRLALAAPGSATLDVLDVTGRLLRTLDLIGGVHQPGEQRFVWDGRRSDGRDAGPGLYIFRVRTGGATLTAKVIRIP